MLSKEPSPKSTNSCIVPIGRRSELSNHWAVKVDEIIPFNFINVRSSGFEYNITYGDGGQVVNAQNALYNKFNEATKYHSYNKPGIYQVKLNASNPYYNIVYQYRMAVQYPFELTKLTHVMFTFFFPPVVYGYCLVMDISYSNTMVSLTPEWDSSYLNIHVTFVGVSFLATMLMVKMMMPLGIGIIYGGCGLICNAGIGYCTAILYW
jgi:hypothetical protein